MSSSRKHSRRDKGEEDEHMGRYDHLERDYVGFRQPQRPHKRYKSGHLQWSGQSNTHQPWGSSDVHSTAYSHNETGHRSEATHVYHIVRFDDSQNTIDMRLEYIGTENPYTGIVSPDTYILYKLNRNEIFRAGRNPIEDEERWIRSLCLEEVIEKVHPDENPETRYAIFCSLADSAVGWRAQRLRHPPSSNPVQRETYGTHLSQLDNQRSVPATTHRSGKLRRKSQDYPEYTSNPYTSSDEWALPEDTFRASYKPRPEDRPESPGDICQHGYAIKRRRCPLCASQLFCSSEDRAWYEDYEE